jgi:hypothetical protein
MKEIISNIWIVSTFIFLSVFSILGQSENQNKPGFAVGVIGGGNKIIYAKESDGLPKEINAKGTIIDASVAGTYCGVTATAGTLKIKLDEKVENYDNDYLYVIVLCLAGKENENLLGQHIEIKVKKMTEFPYTYGVRLASIDSNGTPFYLSTVEGVGGLLEQLEKSKK